MTKFLQTVQEYSAAAQLLTRSSSAVRLVVRIGAWGTFGSRPRLGGKGSRGKPLHISFKVDMLLGICCTDLIRKVRLEPDGSSDNPL